MAKLNLLAHNEVKLRSIILELVPATSNLLRRGGIWAPGLMKNLPRRLILPRSMVRLSIIFIILDA